MPGEGGAGRLRCVAAVQLTVLAATAWMFALVAAVTGQAVLWRLFAVLDSLEVLFVCCALACTRRAVRLLRRRGGRVRGGGGQAAGGGVRGGGGQAERGRPNGVSTPRQNSGMSRGGNEGKGTASSWGNTNGKLPFVVNLRNSGIVMLETSI